jgi:hypothetical protein
MKESSLLQTRLGSRKSAIELEIWLGKDSSARKRVKDRKASTTPFER